jgi:hypothetical protein
MYRYAIYDRYVCRQTERFIKEIAHMIVEAKECIICKLKDLES